MTSVTGIRVEIQTANPTNTSADPPININASFMALYSFLRFPKCL
jgi:hypothetical protein